jgi:acyl dehydratase
MRIFSNFNEIKSALGTEIGTSDWIEVSQERINQFAEATCDEQWIHVDQERAKKELPGGTTIAHGLLSLALAPLFIRSVIGPERFAQHPELRGGQDTVSGAGAGRLKAARPRYGCGSGGRATRWLARELSSRNRDRGRQAPRLRRRVDRPALSLDGASIALNR